MGPQFELAALAGGEAKGAGIPVEVSAIMGIGAILGSGGLYACFSTAVRDSGSVR